MTVSFCCCIHSRHPCSVNVGCIPKKVCSVLERDCVRGFTAATLDPATMQLMHNAALLGDSFADGEEVALHKPRR